MRATRPALLGMVLVLVASAASAGPLSWFPNRELADADRDGVPDGYRVDSLKVRVTADPAGFDGDPCLRIVASGKGAFARVNFPVPALSNQGAEPLYLLLAVRARLRGGAVVRLRWADTANGHGAGQEAAFMPWQDADTSDWMTLRTGITLPPGASLKRIYALVNCAAPDDAVALGSPYLEETDQKRAATCDDPKVWEQVSLPSLDPEQHRGIHKGNLLRNSSFELGPAFLDYPRETAPNIVTDCAWHGRYSLRLTPGGGFGGGNDGTLDFRLTPGKVYSLSFYVRAAQPGTTIGVGILSGWQYSDRAGDLTGDKPHAGVSCEPGAEWRRYTVTFIPKYAPKSCAKLFFVCGGHQPAGGCAYVDGVQLEEGLLSDYRLDRPVDVAAHLETIRQPDAPEHPYGVYRLGEPVAFRVYAQTAEGAARALRLTCLLTDYWGAEAGKQEVSARVSGAWEGRVAFVPAAPGIYKLRVVCHEGNAEAATSEECSLGVLPSRPPGSPEAASSPFGAHVTHSRLATLSPIAAAGVRWLRLHDGYSYINDWASVEPEPGRFDFTRGDEAVAELRKRGFLILGRLGSPPPWAKLDPATKLPEVDPWLRYVREIVGHYRGRIDYWEVLNEPYYSCQPEHYAAFLRATAPVIREANPKATVVGICGYLEGGFYREWFGSVLRQNVAGALDVVSHHGYLFGLPEFVSPSLEQRLRTLRGWLDGNGGQGTPIWDTEWCILSDSFLDDRLFGSDNASMRGNVSWGYRDACAWLVRQHLVSLANGCSRLFLYSTGSTSFSLSYRSTPYHGLLEYTNAPHPTLLAYAALTSRLDGAVFAREVDLGAQIKCYTFRRGSIALATLWRVTDRGDRSVQACRVPLPAAKVRVLDIMGAPCRTVRATGDGFSVDVGGEPIYLEAAGMTVEDLGAALARTRTGTGR